MGTKAVAKKVVKPAVKAAAKAVVRPAPATAAKGGSKPTALMLELCKATGLKMDPGEAKDKFAHRLCEAVAAMDDDAYGKLSAAAQAWYNKAAEQIQAGKKADTSGLDPTQGTTTGRAPAAAPAKAAKSAKPVKAQPEGVRGRGVAASVREMVVKKPAVTFETVASAVGVEPKIGGHVWNIYNEAKRVMEVVAAHAA